MPFALRAMGRRGWVMKRNRGIGGRKKTDLESLLALLRRIVLDGMSSLHLRLQSCIQVRQLCDRCVARTR
jgi:hypothetical protein